MTADISRIFADPQKQYRSVVRQQGRLPTDAEENHSEEIDSWLEDAIFSDVISPLGTPDDGFRILLDGAGNGFDIGPGTFYLGGARVTNPQALPYADQKGGNWLTMHPTGDAIDPASRFVVWLDAEERLVTAVEDGELLEPALRGPDGAARTRMCWKVRRTETEAETCDEALADALGGSVYALHDEPTGRIASTGSLAVGFTNSGPDLDLCKPSVDAGYLGDRNATFRVKLSSVGRVVWGEDNGSQLYRVLLDPGTDRVHFLTHPRDEWQRPKAGDTIELLRGDCALGNGERIAERDGLLLTVDSGYAEGGLSADLSATAAWLGDLAAGADADATAPVHIYLRVWNGGGDAGAGTPDIPYTAGTALPLGATGLTVTLSGSLQAGDSWTFSARLDAPALVLPWAMIGGMPPHWPRRHVVALGIVDLATGEIHDCRPRFRPLHRIRSCCTVTVGDGESSHGDTDDIADAVSRLDPDGGTICLLPGTHSANVFIEGRRNIRIHGCPGLTHWHAEDEADALLTLIDCVDIEIEDIAMLGGTAPCIVAATATPVDRSIANGPLTLHGCTLDAPYGFALSARQMAGVTMAGCTVIAGPYPEASPDEALSGHNAIELQGADLVVEHSRISAPAGTAPLFRALGGIHIRSGSQRVTIRDCEIDQGHSSGIVLGSIIYVAADVTVEATMTEAALAAHRVDMQFQAMEMAESAAQENKAAYLAHAIEPQYYLPRDKAGCIKIPPIEPGPKRDPAGNETVPISEGTIVEVTIERTAITGMGGSGIATFPLLMLASDGGIGSDAIAVERLRVIGNVIFDCDRNEKADMTDAQRLFTGFGGIALAMASDALFRENRIEDNGLANAGSTCGISIIFGEALRFEDNQILRNGRFERGKIPLGPNSAIDVKFATGGLPTILANGDLMRPADRSAISVLSNTCDAPAGRALRVLARGPVHIIGNRLTGANQSRLFGELAGSLELMASLWQTLPERLRAYALLDILLDLAGGDAVHIGNIGVAEDFWIQLLGRPPEPPATPAAGEVATPHNLTTLLGYGFVNIVLNRIIPESVQGGGEVMFADNQVSLRHAAGIETAPPVAAADALDTRKTAQGRQFTGNYTAGSPHGYESVRNPGSTKLDGVGRFGGGGVGGVSSIFIATLDDLGFANNQFEIESDRLLCLVNAILLGLSVRAHGSRGQEAAMGLRSIAAAALRFLNVYHNQTTLPIWCPDVLIGTGRSVINNNSAV